MAKNTSKNQPVAEPEENEQLSESYISIGLGLLVVIVVGILLYNYFTQKKNPIAETPDSSAEITEEATSAAKPGGTYTVQAGDTLWSIAEKSYKDGFQWKQIAEANNIANNDQLVAGQSLKIPEISATASGAEAPNASPVAVSSPEVAATVSPTVNPTVSPAVEVKPTSSPETLKTQPGASPVPQAAAITGSSYTVQAGDTLWSIACRAYNDCYAWGKIAQANKLANPDLIFAGNVFTIPR